MRRTILAAVAAVLIAVPAARAADGDETGHVAGQPAQRQGDLVIERAWARQPLGATGAAYVTIRNEGAEPDRLVAVATDVADRAELHAHAMADGVMRMRPLDALEVPPGEPAAMQPGGTHVMLTGLTRQLDRGDSFAMTLRFERAGDIEVTVRVMGPGASGPRVMDGDHMDDESKGHGGGHCDAV